MMYAELMRKKCSYCDIEKDLKDFASKRGKPNSRCRKCIGEYMKQHYLKNRDREVLKRKEWYRKNQFQAIASIRKNYVLNKEEINIRRRCLKYGFTKEFYLKMIEEHAGKCAVCKRPNSGKDLAVDHDHKSGKVRGLLCDPCNTALGLLKENIERMQSLIEYVQKHQK